MTCRTELVGVVIAASIALTAFVSACSSPSGPAVSTGHGGGDSRGPVAASTGGGGGATSVDSASTSTAAGAGGSGGCLGCARDWAKSPPIVTIDDAAEIFAVSDVHGDYDAYVTLLVSAQLLAAVPDQPNQAHWTGGQAVLVVVGDLIDKGPDSLDVIQLTMALADSASAAGGRVVATMGNHEAEFLADPENAKASALDGVDAELASVGWTPEDTALGKNAWGAFLRGLPFAARVNGWFFAHAGPTDGRTLDELGAALRTDVDAHGFGAPLLSDPGSILEARLSNTGPLWWDATGDPKALLDAWMGALGVNHVVVGHQPGDVAFADGSLRPRDTIFTKYKRRLCLIDTGLSVHVDATGGAWLHIIDPGTANEASSVILPDGSSQPL